MPRKAIDHSKTIIYRIVSKIPTITKSYIGYTTNLTRRKHQHKIMCNDENSKDYNHYLYRYIRNKGGWDNWYLIELELFNCDSSREAESRTRFWKEFYYADLDCNCLSNEEI